MMASASTQTQTYPGDGSTVTDADVARDAVALARSSFAHSQQLSIELDDERRERADERDALLRRIRRFEREAIDLRERNLALEAADRNRLMLDNMTDGMAAAERTVPTGDAAVAAAAAPAGIITVAPTFDVPRLIPSTVSRPLLRSRRGNVLMAAQTSPMSVTVRRHAMLPAVNGPADIGVEAYGLIIAPPPPRTSPY